MVLVPLKQIDSAKAFIIATLCRSGVLNEQWSRLSDEWKGDSDVALAALTFPFETQHLFTDGTRPPNLVDLPDNLRKDRNFLLEAVKRNPQLWFSLPPAFETDPGFVKVIGSFTWGLITEVFRRFPGDLPSDREVWLKCADSGLDIHNLINLHAPPCIRKDKSVMLKACSHAVSCFELVDPSLFDAKDFVEGIVDCSSVPEPLKFIPHNVQLRWPDLAIKYFQNNRQTGEWVALAQQVAPELWNNRAVVEGWFRAGLPYVDECFPQEWKEDSSIFLLVAEHCGKAPEMSSSTKSILRSLSFRKASTTLRGTKDFMLRAVQLNPDTLPLASASLQKDFDVVVTAVAHWNRARHDEYDKLERDFCIGNEGDLDYFSFVESVGRKIGEKLDSYSKFSTILLPGMKFGGDLTTLTLLNQGTETALEYKKRIADFLDVPCGAKLRFLRQAAANLPSLERIRQHRREFEVEQRQRRRSLQERFRARIRRGRRQQP